MWTLFASVTLVVATGIVTFLVVRSTGPRAAPDDEVFRALRATPLDATPASDGPSPTSAAAPRGGAFADATALPPNARDALGVVEGVERGHAAGTWSVARKRFEPCPGQDLERVALIDGSSRVVKLTETRAAGERGGPAITIEQWFDVDGRLRGVRAARADQAWTLRALFDGSGAAVHRDVAGDAPSLDSLAISPRDPSSAFFTVPRCEPGKR